MATVLITGGTGLIGKVLTNALLDKNYHVIIVSRETTLANPDSYQVKPHNLSFAHWNIARLTIDKDAIAKADYIIHLAGAGVADKRWTKKRKEEIINSRVESGKLLVKAIHDIPNNIKAVICASAIGWYGPDPAIPNPNPFVEHDPASKDFLGETCKKWEASVEQLSKPGRRLVKFRIGIVLSKNGGALREFERPIRWGVAAILGSGRQMISWIHIDDLVNLLVAGIENENMIGTYNAVAPHPVTNKELTLQLAKTKKGKFFVPVHVPAFLLKWILGELSVEVLKSASVSSAKIQDAGFTFQYPSLDAGLKSLK